MTPIRELLEKAAGAMKIEKHYPFGPGEIYVRHEGLWAHHDTSDDAGALTLWNPAESSADCFDMETKLELDGPYWDSDEVGYLVPGSRIAQRGRVYESFTDHPDKYAARRMAALRAAASMPAPMPGAAKETP
jgi:hypothetical protein